MLKLYHHTTSTCSKRVRICLAEKGLEWESVIVDLRIGTNREPWYVELNPNGVVPTLDHDGKIMIESNFILEYLEDAFTDTSLRPADPYQRQKMRYWMDQSEHFLHRNVNVISQIKQNRLERYAHLSDAEKEDMLAKVPRADARALLANRLKGIGLQPEDMAFAEARIAEGMDQLEEILTDQAWIAGETFSLADISIAPFIERFEANELERIVDWQARPHVGDWWGRVQARESYQIGMFFPGPGD